MFLKLSGRVLESYFVDSSVRYCRTMNLNEVGAWIRNCLFAIFLRFFGGVRLGGVGFRRS